MRKRRQKIVKVRQKIRLNTRNGNSIVYVSMFFLIKRKFKLKSRKNKALKAKSLLDTENTLYDHISTKIDDCDSVANSNYGKNNRKEFKRVLIKFLSLMYALFLVIIGSVIIISGIGDPFNPYEQIFEIIITVVGIAWMIFFHWDIQKYKKWTVHQIMSKSGTKRRLNRDRVCDIFTDDFEDFRYTEQQFDGFRYVLSDYLFCRGKNSGNFYLKCGMILFCMGSIVHQCVLIAKQLHFYISDNTRCFQALKTIYSLLFCTFSFYQLYIVFKYSNILINRYKTVAIFALMHLVGCSVLLWLSTIIEETLEDYVYKVEYMNGTYNYSVIDDEAMFKNVVSHHMYCSKTALINTDSMEALPYLYPFSIEYNIILASVWYQIWTNIGKTDMNALLHHIRREVSENLLGVMEINYKSSISINVDCHASNLGLFIGLLTLLLIFSTMIIFFATMRQTEYKEIGVGIYSAQIGILIALCVIIIPFAYSKVRKLDIVSINNINSSLNAMDDFLVLIPLPFFMVYYLLAIKAESLIYSINSVCLVIIRVLSVIHISIQTPFIVDASRRCANRKKLRFTKPGRGMIMFLLLLNITLWILYTFESKSVDKDHNMENYYGKFIWMCITHTTMPLMLFYYFHCSVCLSDIWKYAYEKNECYNKGL